MPSVRSPQLVLMWSATKVGNVMKELIRFRGERYKIDDNELKEQRENL